MCAWGGDVVVCFSHTFILGDLYIAGCPFTQSSTTALNISMNVGEVLELSNTERFF